MKIGLVSIHSAHNYGSVLQAYALQETLKKYSDNVEIINYRPKYFDMMYDLFSFSVYQKYHGFVNKILHFIWRIIKLPQRVRKYEKFEKFIRNRYDLTSKRFAKYEDLEKVNFDYDAVFVGSDQVWNTDITEGFDKTFYLAFVSDGVKKISYAASVARNSLDNRFISDYKKYLNRFDDVSVREKTSKDLLTNLVAKKVKVVIDPTLLVRREKWNELSKQSKINVEGKKYIFTYILQDNDELNKIVNAISEKTGMQIISIGKRRRFKHEKVCSDAGPEDFLHLIKNASFVITNSFHGSVFSVIFEKPVCVIPHLNTGNRMIDLYKKIGLSSRLVETIDSLNIESILTCPDYVAVKIKLEKEINKSLDFIKSALEVRKDNE